MRPREKKPRSLCSHATETMQCPPKPNQIRVGASSPQNDRLVASDRRTQGIETEAPFPTLGVPRAAQLLVTNRVDIAWPGREVVVRVVDARRIRAGLFHAP